MKTGRRASVESEARGGAHVQAPFFVMRTPSLPLNTFLDAPGINASVEEVHASQHQALGELKELVDRRYGLARDRLIEIASRPEVLEALLVASPKLHARLGVFLDAPNSDEGRRIELSLLKYVLRMSTRSTPFGLFAGSVMGEAGRETALKLAERDLWRRRVHLDMNYATAVSRVLAQRDDVKAAIKFYSNNTAFEMAGRLHYVEVDPTEAGQRKYRLSAVDPTEYLERVLRIAANGARLEELARALVGEEIELGEAREYIEELIAAGLLLPGVEPMLSLGDPLNALLGQVAEVPTLAVERDVLRRIVNECDSMRDGTERIVRARYEVIEGLVRQLVPVESEHLVHVELRQQADALTLGPDVAAELLRAARLLNGIRVRADTRKLELSRFKELFAERYGDATIPLCQVLDEEHGIPWRGDIAEAAGGNEEFGTPEDHDDVGESDVEAQLGRLVWEAARAGATSCELTDDVVERLRFPEGRVPDLGPSFAVHAQLLAPTGRLSHAAECKVYVRSVSRHSACHWFGRFCNDDERLQSHVSSFLARTDALEGDAVVAEIVHLPQGRAGNVVLRPRLRDTEISFLTRSCAQPERVITVDDLFVTVRAGRIILRSKRLGCEVLPRMSNSHYPLFTRNLGAYTFLWLMQFERREMLGWSWGRLSSLPFLPRVEYGRIILSPACWRFTGEEVARLNAKERTLRFAEAQKLRRQYGLPRYVLHRQGDNDLPIDLDNPLCVDLAARALRTGPAYVVEMLSAPNNGAVEGSDGVYAHELIVPFESRAPLGAGAKRTRTASLTELASRRTVFGPGSEWAYLKLYTGTATADRIARSVLPAFIENCRSEAGIDSWFFVRYADPDFHIRLRLHGDPERLGVALPTLIRSSLAQLLAAGTVRRTCIDTYEPEYERYGGLDALAIVERLFCLDSEAAVRLLRLLEGASAEARWMVTLCGVNATAMDFTKQSSEAAAWLRETAGGFGGTVIEDTAFRQQVSERYRKLKSRLETVLGEGTDVLEVVEQCRPVLAWRSRMASPEAARLTALSEQGLLTRSLGEIVGSLMHMHVNRMHRTVDRRAELEYYEILARHHLSLVARTTAQNSREKTQHGVA